MWINLGIPSKDGVDIAENDEKIRTAKHGRPRRKRVVVAKSNLIACDGVIFIDDRNHPHLKQSGQRPFCIAKPRPIFEIGSREKHLRTTQAVVLQFPFIVIHEHGLPYGGKRLKRGQRFLPVWTRNPHEASSKRNGTARHNDDLALIGTKPRDHLNETAKDPAIQRFVSRPSQHGTSNLEHNAPCSAEFLSIHRRTPG